MEGHARNKGLATDLDSDAAGRGRANGKGRGCPNDVSGSKNVTEMLKPESSPARLCVFCHVIPLLHMGPGNPGYSDPEPQGNVLSGC